MAHHTHNDASIPRLPVVIQEQDERTAKLMRWGLVPRWTKPGETPNVQLINPKVEMAHERSMFRGLIRHSRSPVPPSGFYEWRRQGSHKQPYLIRLKDG